MSLSSQTTSPPTTERINQFIKICDIMQNELSPVKDEISSIAYFTLVNELCKFKESLVELRTNRFLEVIE